MHALDRQVRLFELLVHVSLQIFGLLLNIVGDLLFGLRYDILSGSLYLFFEKMLGQCEVDQLHPMRLHLV